MTMIPGATDADLLARCAQGDDVAFTEPGVRYLSMIHAICRRVLGVSDSVTVNEAVNSIRSSGGG